MRHVQKSKLEKLFLAFHFTLIESPQNTNTKVRFKPIVLNIPAIQFKKLDGTKSFQIFTILEMNPSLLRKNI